MVEHLSTWNWLDRCVVRKIAMEMLKILFAFGAMSSWSSSVPAQTVANALEEFDEAKSTKSVRPLSNGIPLDQANSVAIELMILESPKRWFPTFSSASTAPGEVAPLLGKLDKGEKTSSVFDLKSTNNRGWVIELKEYHFTRNTDNGTKAEDLNMAELVDIMEQKALSGLWDEDVRVCNELMVISRPKLKTFRNVMARTKVGGVSSLAYFAPKGKTTFELKQLPPQELGFELSVTPKNSDQSPEHVLLDPVEIATVAMTGRERIAGTDLPVGKPIIETRSLKTSLTIKQGDTGYVEIPTAPGKFAMLVFRCTFDVRSPTAKTTSSE